MKKGRSVGWKKPSSSSQPKHGPHGLLFLFTCLVGLLSPPNGRSKSLRTIPRDGQVSGGSLSSPGVPSESECLLSNSFGNGHNSHCEFKNETREIGLETDADNKNGSGSGLIHLKSM